MFSKQPLNHLDIYYFQWRVSFSLNGNNELDEHMKDLQGIQQQQGKIDSFS